MVIWFTGLSGSGKTALSRLLAETLRSQGLRVELLDGDDLRKTFPQTGFSRKERDAHVRRVGFLARDLESSGSVVAVSLISPYEESRMFVRSLCKKFFEVYMSTPIEICEERDVKGLYAKARCGEIARFTGIDDPYEPPLNPDLSLDASRVSLSEGLARVLAEIRPFLK